MNKHTQRSWTQNHDDVIVGDDPENIIAICQWRDGEDGFDETLANARLIAAAPDLLEAAFKFAEYQNFIKKGNDVDAMFAYAELLKLNKAALAKARGTE